MSLLLVHFILTQCRPLLLIYFAYKTLLQDTVIYDVLHSHIRVGSIPAESQAGNSTKLEIGDYVDCLRDDVERSLFTFSERFRGNCFNLDPNMHQIDLALNAAACMIVLIFLASLVVLLLQSGVSNIGQGRYLTFTWASHNSKVYRIASGLQIAFVVYVVFRNLYSLVQELRSGKSHKAIEFVETYGTQVLVLVYSAYKLRANPPPGFDFEDEEFQRLQFARGLSSALTETNHDFDVGLQLALYKAHYGDRSDLKALLSDEGCSNLDEVVKLCRPWTKDGSGSDSEGNGFEAMAFCDVGSDN